MLTFSHTNVKRGGAGGTALFEPVAESAGSRHWPQGVSLGRFDTSGPPRTSVPDLPQRDLTDTWVYAGAPYDGRPERHEKLPLVRWAEPADVALVARRQLTHGPETKHLVPVALFGWHGVNSLVRPCTLAA
ncbi:hypothetical protein AB0O20_16190 [Streptomyces kronopolitis]|uniref:hypothetical protein n=1 Tax=Streptomyces kronopolitis TaxID=1612435 RepID=UPI00343E6467